MTRYCCNLTPYLLEKAVKELNEPSDNKERIKAIDALKESFDSNQYGELLRSDDLFFLRFLRAKKFNLEKALTVLQHYHTVRKEVRDIFSLVENPTPLKKLMDSGIMYFLRGKSKAGESILLYRPGLLAPQFSVYHVMAYGVICVEQMLDDEEFQICGIITVDDLAHFGVTSLAQTSLSAGKTFGKIWEDAMPVRIRNIYIFNEGKAFDIVYYFFKFFIEKKIKKRIKLRGSNYAALHEEVDPVVLPPCLLGTGMNMEDGCKEWVNKLQQKFVFGF